MLVNLKNGVIIHISSCNLRQALADYNKSIELKKDNFQAYYYRARLYLYQDKHKSAIDDLTKAIALNPQFAESYKNRAVAYDKIGEAEKAEADRKRYEELSKRQ